jgi:hypothetical protein
LTLQGKRGRLRKEKDETVRECSMQARKWLMDTKFLLGELTEGNIFKEEEYHETGSQPVHCE